MGLCVLCLDGCFLWYGMFDCVPYLMLPGFSVGFDLFDCLCCIDYIAFNSN